MTSDYSDEGYVQDYQLGRRQELFIYCRMCRSTFPVAFVPKSRRAKLRCLCGHEAALDQLDVFRTQAEAQHHADLYEKVYRAAKAALKDAGIPLPPSGKYQRVEDVERDSGFTSFYSEEEDASSIRDGYLSDSEGDLSGEALEAGLLHFEERLDGSQSPLERHEVLSELIEWSYCRRHFLPEVRERFRDACREDIELAPEVIRDARRLTRSGRKVRLSFTSFKHLCLDLEEARALRQALEVAQAAEALGLKGYADLVRRLRAELGE